MLKDKKKTQLSIFIIISIIIVIVMAFIFFSEKINFWTDPDLRIKNQVTDIVNTCIEEHGKTGAFLLGFQGGYIDIPPLVLADPRKYIDLGLKIPNWDTQRNFYPTINSMERELQNYIENEAMSCIRTNLNALENFNIEIEENMITDVRINKENIIVETYLPIRFNEKNSEQVIRITDYFLRLDGIRLGDLYSLAIEIYNTQSQTFLFEELVLDQIYSASDYNDPISMPSEGMHFSCNRRIWTIPQLQSNLANLNNNNFKYLYFQGTYPINDIIEANLNEKYGSEIYRAYYENHYTFSLSNPRQSFQNYGVEVSMPSIEITGRDGYFQRYPYREFSVSPSSGSIVRPINMEIDFGRKIPIPCIQIYAHRYTLDYDLMIKLTDFNEDGHNFFFQFPIRVDIQNNNPKVRTPPIIPFEPRTLNNENYCLEENKLYPVLIYAIDKTNNEFIPNVNISYQCMNLKCEIGTTNPPINIFAMGGTPQPFLEANFPFCIGGNIIAEKEGYHTSRIRIDTTDEILRNPASTQGYHDIELIPLKEYIVDIGTFLAIDENNMGRVVYNENDGSFYVSISNNEYEFETQGLWPNEPGFLDKIHLLDMEGIQYNITVIFADTDYELRGILEIENMELNPNEGNSIRFVVPSKTTPIEYDEYLDFYEFMTSQIENEFSRFGVFIN